jgi:hypothetical protein
MNHNINNMIKYNSIIQLYNITHKDQLFDPLPYIKNSIIHNAFDIFKFLINHNNCNHKLIDDDVIILILKKILLCNNDENHKFLNELYNINYNFKIIHLEKIINNYDLFIKIFNIINFDELYKLHKLFMIYIDIPNNIYNYIFDYGIKKFDKLFLTDDFCDELVKKALLYYNIEKLELLYKNNINILYYKNKSSFSYIISLYFLENISPIDVITYLSTLKPKYNNNLFEELFNNNIVFSYSDLYIMKNLQKYYHIIKPYYKNLNSDFLLKKIIYIFYNIDNYYNITSDFIYEINNIILFLLEQQLITINPLSYFEYIYTIKYKPDNFKLMIHNIIQLIMKYGFVPTQIINDFINNK